MKKKIIAFCSTIYARHIGYFMGYKISKNKPHNADYEVCPDVWCRIAYKLEVCFGLFEYPTTNKEKP